MQVTLLTSQEIFNTAIFDDYLSFVNSPEISVSYDQHPVVVFDFYAKKSSSRGNPALAIVKDDDDQILAIAPFYVQNSSIKLSFGSRHYSLKKSCELYLLGADVICRENIHDIATKLILQKMLQEYENSYLILKQHELPSRVAQYCIQNGIFTYSLNLYYKNSLIWYLDLHDDINDFFKGLGRKSRESLRRKIRKFEKKFGPRNVKCFDSNVDEYLRDVNTIYQKSWHLNYYDKAWLQPQTKKFYKELAKHGLFRSYILYVGDDEQPIAYIDGFLLDREYKLDFLGYDENFTRDNPGNVLLYSALEMFIEESGDFKFNYGFGDNQYKRTFGNRKIDANSTVLTNSTFHKRIINIQHLIDKLYGKAVAFSEKVGLKAKLRKWMRSTKK